MPRILVLQPRRQRRAEWAGALALAGHHVVARESVKTACAALWLHDFDALIAATPPEQELYDLLEAAPGPWPPPILLVGAPFGEGVGVPRAFAASICVGTPPAARLPAMLCGLLAGAGVARPAVPHGRADVPMRLPAERVVKWRSWLVASPVAN